MAPPPDHTRHAVCVGMTGSGKTGLCLGVHESLALDGTPLLLVDPKGDLTNLALVPPSLRAGAFRPFADPSTHAAADAWQASLAREGVDDALLRQ
jgi:hypothetical protein